MSHLSVPVERWRWVSSLLSGRDDALEAVSRTLHDDVGQTLTAIGLQLDSLRLDYARQAPELAARVAGIQELLEQVIAQARQLTNRVHPDIAGRSGIHHAMDVLVGRYREKFKGTIRWNGDASARPGRDASTGMYRVADLALDNAVKHGNATLIEVILSPSTEGLRLEIKDNGIGFDATVMDPPPGLGLPLMRYYAERAGLTLFIRSAPGSGSEIRVTCPKRDAGASKDASQDTNTTAIR